MPSRVKLSEIIDALDMQGDESQLYLNKLTGEIVLMQNEFLEAAEEGDDSDYKDGADWARETYEEAVAIVQTDNYVPLPSQFDVHEWQIMKDFCYSVEDDDVRTDLINAIHGSGAFRMFKTFLRRHNLTDRWYQFRKQAFRDIAREWCQENGIDFSEE